MKNLVAKMVGDKREWKQMEARAAALPAEFRGAYEDLKPVLFGNTAGDGMDSVAALKKALEVFEAAVADGKDVHEAVSGDVAAFAEELLPAAESYRAQVINGVIRDLERMI